MRLHEAVACLRRRAFLRKHPKDYNTGREGGVPLSRCLTLVDLLLLAIGSAVGAGIFVVTGVAAQAYAGPAVVLSYLFAGLTAFLAGLSYLEFAVDLPAAGGAFSYTAFVFGEVPAWIVACNIILEYTLSTAAVARGFSAYGATLLGFDSDAFLLVLGPVRVDGLACVLVILLAALLCYGTAESSFFNNIVTTTNLIIIVYVLCAGLPYGHTDNMKPFAPFGLHGVFAASSIVFFSFVGFDGAINAAEEAKDPKDLPWSIMGALAACCFLYVLMALAMCLMQSYTDIDVGAPFSSAFLDLIPAGSSPKGFQRIFLTTSARFISFGALTGNTCFRRGLQKFIPHASHP